MNRLDTFNGALLAAIIAFLGGLLALLQEVDAVTDISSKALLVLVVTSLLSFVKDFQAISMRQVSANVRAKMNGTPNAFFGAILGGVLALAMFSGCASQRPGVDSVSDAIVVTAADIETIAQQVRRACGHTTPGGRCVPGALIDTDTKNDLARRLQDALDAVKLANVALINDEAIEADNKLARARTILMLVRGILAESETT